MTENMEVSSRVDTGLGEELGYTDLQKIENDVLTVMISLPIT